MAVKLYMSTLPPVSASPFRAGGRASLCEALGEPGQAVLGSGFQVWGLLTRVPKSWSGQAGVVALVEALGEQVELVLDCDPGARAGLLASLAGAVAAQAAPPDARFACLKLLCDATLARLCCPRDSAGALATHARQRQDRGADDRTGTQACCSDCVLLAMQRSIALHALHQ